eukprot:NODE_896_length_1249_cov_99.244167_g665_i0.p2 GENE.NODE_896_length_1249_cov_99.244167_g665_i0~~NODE_896_length_1249_cov_99.244167_g665_i0.p2  ORF type:complete len:265 (-),score=74.09 NODE_896_length_1249_cov_99.244167_g665_i0:320-1114(-)
MADSGFGGDVDFSAFMEITVKQPGKQEKSRIREQGADDTDMFTHSAADNDDPAIDDFLSDIKSQRINIQIQKMMEAEKAARDAVADSQQNIILQLESAVASITKSLEWLDPTINLALTGKEKRATEPEAQGGQGGGKKSKKKDKDAPLQYHGALPKQAAKVDDDEVVLLPPALMQKVKLSENHMRALLDAAVGFLKEMNTGLAQSEERWHQYVQKKDEQMMLILKREDWHVQKLRERIRQLAMRMNGQKVCAQAPDTTTAGTNQ